jgi:hypothetical protein
MHQVNKLKLYPPPTSACSVVLASSGRIGHESHGRQLDLQQFVSFVQFVQLHQSETSWSHLVVNVDAELGRDDIN